MAYLKAKFELSKQGLPNTWPQESADAGEVACTLVDPFCYVSYLEPCLLCTYKPTTGKLFISGPDQPPLAPEGAFEQMMKEFRDMHSAYIDGKDAKANLSKTEPN